MDSDVLGDEDFFLLSILLSDVTKWSRQNRSFVTHYVNTGRMKTFCHDYLAQDLDHRALLEIHALCAV